MAAVALPLFACATTHLTIPFHPSIPGAWRGQKLAVLTADEGTGGRVVASGKNAYCASELSVVAGGPPPSVGAAVPDSPFDRVPIFRFACEPILAGCAVVGSGEASAGAGWIGVTCFVALGICRGATQI
jgi:hypothetical protein